MENIEKKYSIFRAFCKPITDLTDNCLSFLRICLSAAFILTVLALVFGQPYGCTTPSFQDQTFCSNNLLVYIIYIVFKLFLISVFLRTWYDAVYLQKNINISYFKLNLFRFLKLFAIFVFFIFLNLMPILSVSLLLIRVPNPDFRIELVYFSVVSIGLFIPFVLLRFYTNLAEYLEDLPFKNFGEVASKTRFKLSKIFFSFSIILAFCLFLFLTVNNALKVYTFKPFFLYNIIAEFFFELTVLILSILIINFIRVQKESFE